MAIMHLTPSVIGRGSSGSKSAVRSAAYRHRARMRSEALDREDTYENRGDDLLHEEMSLPKDAPDWATDRSKLWNEVEASETRRNSVTAREWELALPSEISGERQLRRCAPTGNKEFHTMYAP